jgi:hypothetical protein
MTFLTAHCLVIKRDGTIKCVYNDRVQPTLEGLGGKMSIRRASHVEPTADCKWEADLSPSQGPVLGPFERREDALEAERAWLGRNL